MPSKDPTYQARYHREVWYPANKAKRLQLNKAWRERKQTEYLEYKSTLKCQLCGEAESCCLDFHHIESDKKDFSVATRSRYTSLTKLKEEIDKCVVLCSNCHRKVHAGIAQL